MTFSMSPPNSAFYLTNNQQLVTSRSLDKGKEYFNLIITATDGTFRKPTNVHVRFFYIIFLSNSKYQYDYIIFKINVEYNVFVEIFFVNAYTFFTFFFQINYIFEKHRYIMTLNGLTPQQLAPNIEGIRQLIQRKTGNVAIIETFRTSLKQDGSSLAFDNTG